MRRPFFTIRRTRKAGWYLIRRVTMPMGTRLAAPGEELRRSRTSLPGLRLIEEPEDDGPEAA